VAFRGYHGTPASRLTSIRESGIRPSTNPDDWLGTGTYFFVDGLDDPKRCALEWARCKAWDKHQGEFVEQDLAVVEADILVPAELVLDLRVPVNAREFHHFRRDWIRAHIPRRATHSPRPEDTTYDTQLIDDFRRQRGVAVLIEDFHIQFSIRERHFRMDSRIPNVSVLCLSHPTPREVTVAIGGAEVEHQSSFLESESR
jgi:hypothetical protein